MGAGELDGDVLDEGVGDVHAFEVVDEVESEQFAEQLQTGAFLQEALLDQYLIEGLVAVALLLQRLLDLGLAQARLREQLLP